MKNLNLLGRGFGMFSLFLCTLLVTNTTMRSQDFNDICILGSTNATTDTDYSYATTAIKNTSAQPLVLNVYYWQVKDSNGTFGGANFNEDDLLANIAHLNINFNKFHIFFKYRGYGVIESTPNDLPLDIYENIDEDGDGELDGWQCNDYPGQFDPDGYGIMGRCSNISSFWNYAINNNYKMANAINIYVPYASEFGGAARTRVNDMIILKIDKLTEVTATHEMGHALGLWHTRAIFNGVSDKEHKTRDKFLPDGTLNGDFNAEQADDEVVDTAANTQFSHGGTYPWITVDCGYDGPEKDEIDIPYEIFPEDVKNAMSDAYGCVTNYLTPGQGHRMRETILDENILSETLTTVSSLYEPYKGEYYVGGPFFPQQPLFQPGFEYYFLECDCDCPQPIAYEDISFSYSNNVVLYKAADESNYNNITHPNHTAIGIKIELPIFWPQPRRCYDNNNVPSIGGAVTKFNDNTFNSNVTITPKDSTAINNPNLINNLPQGLYAIDKYYQDGSTEQTIIVKENN